MSCVLDPKKQSQRTAVKRARAQGDEFDIASGGSTSSGKKNKSTKAGVGATCGETNKSTKSCVGAKCKTAKKPRTEACDAASPQDDAGAPPEKETAESDELPGPTQFWFGSQTAAASNVKGELKIDGGVLAGEPNGFAERLAKYKPDDFLLEGDDLLSQEWKCRRSRLYKRARQACQDHLEKQGVLDADTIDFEAKLYGQRIASLLDDTVTLKRKRD